MRVQLIGLGNVGRNPVQLMIQRQDVLSSLGHQMVVVSVSDSNGTAVDTKGLDLNRVLKHKMLRWTGFNKYVKGYTALKAIREIGSEVVVELTPSTPDGELGLSNIKTALTAKKNVVTANKGILVVAYKDLIKIAKNNGVQLLYEPTVAAHVPVFCLTS
jgi:homoserine dehydrogenase